MVTDKGNRSTPRKLNPRITFSSRNLTCTILGLNPDLLEVGIVNLNETNDIV
jgi:hypothetical protein